MEKSDTLLIKGGKVITMDGPIYDRADILIENGVIKEIKESILGDFKSIDATGKIVIPGFIEAHSHIGIEEPNGDNPGNLNETSNPITPYLNALDGVNFFDESFQRALESGITTVATGPGSANVIGGTFSILKTYGKNPLVRIVREKSSMKVALGENPKRIYGSKSRAPITKMGIAYLLRDTLDSTIVYRNKKINKVIMKDYFEEVKTYEEMIHVLEENIPLSVHAHRADDIITAIRIADEYRIKIQLLHGTEGSLLIDEIKKRDIPAILGPIMSFSKKAETKFKTPKTAIEFIENGILTAISTDHPITPIEYLPINAALCVREGMDYIRALEAITINPAKILGIDKSVGSISVGKDGDIVIFDNNPLNPMSRVNFVIGKGEIVYEV